MPLSSRGSPPAPIAADLAAARVYDLTWPDDLLFGTTTIGANASLTGVARHNVGGVVAFTSSAVSVYALHKGRPCVSIPPGAGTGLTSVPAWYLPLTRRAEGGIGAGAYYGRVLFDLAMSAAGGDNQRDTGLYFGVRAVGVVNLPTVSAFTFGIARDGAGGWNFIATKAGGGVFSINQAIAWPVAADEWCSGEYRLYPATKDDEARVELWLRGVLVISFAWGAGTLLPDYSGVANALGFALVARSRNMGGGNSRNLLLAGLRFIQSTEAES